MRKARDCPARMGVLYRRYSVIQAGWNSGQRSCIVFFLMEQNFSPDTCAAGVAPRADEPWCAFGLVVVWNSSM